MEVGVPNSANGSTRVPAGFEPRPFADIGLLALATDHAIDSEVRLPLPAGATCVHTSRMASANQFDMTSLARIFDDIERACGVLLPETKLSAIAYGCTSGTVAAGEQRIIDALNRLKPGTAATTPVTAALAAFKALDISEISLLTPYSREVHEAIDRFLRERGIAIAKSVYFDVNEDNRITAISGDSLLSAIVGLARESAAPIFVSCTALRIVGRIAQLEKRSERIIVTSNQALAWHCLRLVGNRRAIPGYGRLFEEQL